MLNSILDYMKDYVKDKEVDLLELGEIKKNKSLKNIISGIYKFVLIWKIMA